ncbi:MAG TPA: hypothetical protein VKX25_04080 [Bryobacteraceae bacterium]|nr:hypothetical protein [Bryobacteraceae bacterium]
MRSISFSALTRKTEPLAVIEMLKQLVLVRKDDRELYPLGFAFTDIRYGPACEAINRFLRVRTAGGVALCD